MPDWGVALLSIGTFILGWGLGVISDHLASKRAIKRERLRARLERQRSYGYGGDGEATGI